MISEKKFIKGMLNKAFKEFLSFEKTQMVHFGGGRLNIGGACS
jgi:hypothetical protein